MTDCGCYVEEVPYDDFPGIRNTFVHHCSKHAEEHEKKNQEYRIKREIKERRERDEKKAYTDYLNSIETLNFVPIKNAVSKYRCAHGISNSDNWIMKHLLGYSVLQVHKKNHRWVCSKERLDVIDFNKASNSC